MPFDDEITLGWCLGATWRCTVSEASGLWSVLLFYTTVLMTTVVHGIVQHQTGTAARSEAATRRHTGADVGEDLGFVCWLVIYFFSFAAGCLLWATGGVRWVHPVQLWQLQLIGTAILVACVFLYIAAHVHLGANWSPMCADTFGARSCSS